MTTAIRLCHVINLPRRPDRRADFLRLNAGKGEFIFTDGIEGDSLSRAALEADGFLAPGSQGITQGALGCAMAHKGLWEQCVEDGEPMVIFEDDACLVPNFAERAAAALAAAAARDITYFGYNLDQSLAVYLAEGVVAAMKIADQAVTGAGWLDTYASRPDFAPATTALLRPAVVWGLLAYAITPAGALRMLSQAFPLRNHELSLLQGPSMSRGIDGSVLALIQQGAITAACCFPPLVIGPNNDSDTEGGVRKRGP